MKKQIDVWEGEVNYSYGFNGEGWCVGDDKIDEIVSHIESIDGKKVRVTIEVIE